MIYIILYIVLTALSAIFRNIVGNIMPTMLLIFTSITTALVFFSVLNLNKLPAIYAKSIKHWPQLLMLNLLILVIWIGSFLIPVYYSPYIQLIVFMNVSAAGGVLYTFLMHKNKYLLIKLSCLILNLIIFYFLLHEVYSNAMYLYLIVGSLATGVCGFLYILESAKCNKAGFSAVEVLAIRFWLLWFFTLIYCIVTHQFANFKLIYIGQGMFIGLISLIFPVYALQKAIEKLGAGKTGVLLGLAPILCFILEKIMLHSELGFAAISSVSLAIILIIFFIYEKRCKS